MIAGRTQVSYRELDSSANRLAHAGYLPLDPSLPPERLSAICAQVRPAAVIAARPDTFPGIGTRLLPSGDLAAAGQRRWRSGSEPITSSPLPSAESAESAESSRLCRPPVRNVRAGR